MKAAVVKQLFTTLTRSHPIMIFSKSYCPYCKGVKALFNEMDKPFKAFELDLEAEGPAIQEILKKDFNHHTVPAVFIKGSFLGGYSDTLASKTNGSLLEALAEGENVVVGKL